MSKWLYEECPVCKGLGVVTEEAVVCRGCGGARFVSIGLTSSQVERLVAENERLKALVQAPYAAVIVPMPNTMAIDLHVCDLPWTAIELSKRLTAEGRTQHQVYRVSAYHVHDATKGEVSCSGDAS